MSPKRVRIGLFGPRGASKTTFVAAMALIRESDEVSLEITDHDTLKYLAPLMQRLGDGMFPEATRAGCLENLRFGVEIEGKKLEVETVDFAGEHAQPISGLPSIDHVALLEWFGSCDAIIIFVDGTRVDRKQLDAFDAIMKVIDSKALPRSVTLLVTKIDAHRPITSAVVAAYNASGGAWEKLAKEQQLELEKVFANHAILQRVQNQLGRREERQPFEVVLCSAVGWNFASVEDITKREVAPCGIFHTLGIAIDAAVARRLEWRAKRAELVVKSVAAIALVTAVALLGSRSYYSRLLASHAEYCQENSDDALVSDRIQSFTTSIEPNMRVMRFLGLGPQVSAASNHFDRDHNIAQRLEAESQFEAFILKDRELKNLGREAERFPICEAFLNRWGSLLAPGSFEFVKSIQKESHPAWDDKTWTELKAGPISVAFPYEEKAKGLIAYATSAPEFKHLHEAEQLSGTLLQQRDSDQRQYESIARAVVDSSNWENPRAIHAVMEEYLSSIAHDSIMSDFLGGYAAQLDAFCRRKHPVTFVLSRIAIPQSFPTTVARGWPVPKVVLRLGGLESTYVAPDRDDAKLIPSGSNYVRELQMRFDGFHASFADETPLNVEFSIYRMWFASDKERVSANFAPWYRYANSEINVGGVLLNLHCSLPSPPALAKFGATQ